MTALDISTFTTDPPARRTTLRSVLANPLALSSLIVLAALGIVAILEPWIKPYPAGHVDLSRVNAVPFSTDYVLGGDRFGRDILSRLIASTPAAVQGALILGFVAIVVGVSAGLAAGYFGRAFDSIATWIFSVLLAVPAIVVLIALSTLWGASTVVAMGLFGLLVSPNMFWLVRTLTRSVRNELYVDAARVSGLSNLRVVGRHVLIAIRAPVILMAAGFAGAGIAVQAGLEFLGLGDRAAASWGSMLSDAFTNIYRAPEQLIWPAAALGLVTGAFALVSIGVRDAWEGTITVPSQRTLRKQRAKASAALPSREAPEPHTDIETHESPGTPNSSAVPLLRITDLEVAYQTGDQFSRVVDRVSLDVAHGEVVGVVGESGSGKSQTVFAALGLLPETAIVLGGSVAFCGTELLGMPEAQLRSIRGSRMAYVPQEPMSNLDPSFTIGFQLIAGIRAQTDLSRAEARELALSMLERVGLNEPAKVFRARAHEISGGMAQRVLIAGAVACEPELLIADEPTTALDVTIQADILDLLRDLKDEMNMGVLLVTHNFGVVADICDSVVVMRTGAIVEEGPVDAVFSQPRHPYTQMLLDSVLDNTPPRPDHRHGGGIRA